MKRNFNSESSSNLVLRAVRASMGRVRGKLFKSLGFFSPDTSYRIYFGRGSRFINSKSIYLGDNVNFGQFSRLECYPKVAQSNPLISVGDNSSFGDYLHIGATNGVEIGQYVLGGSNVLIMDHSHGKPALDMKEKSKIPPRLRPLTSKGNIVIGNNVWIGDNCVLLSGVRIGDGSIIGAGSIVRGNVESFSIFAN